MKFSIGEVKYYDDRLEFKDLSFEGEKEELKFLYDLLKDELSGEEAEDEEEDEEEEDEEEKKEEEEVVFNFDNICKKIDETKLSQSTKSQSKRSLKKYMDLLPAIEGGDVSTVIDATAMRAKCLETKKTHLNCIVKVCELFNLKSKSLYSDEVKNTIENIKIHKLSAEGEGYLKIEVATEMMNKLEEQIEILTDRKLKSLLIFIRDYGVLRPCEFISIKIYTESVDEIEKKK